MKLIFSQRIVFLFILSTLSIQGCSKAGFFKSRLSKNTEVPAPSIDELSSGSGVDPGQAFLGRTLYEQLLLVYNRVQSTIRNERIDYEGAYLQDVEEDLQIRVEDGEGELFGDIPMRVLIEDASEDPDIAVGATIDSGQISEILELREKLLDRGLAVFYQGTQDDEFNQDLDTGLELIAVKGRAEGGAKDGEKNEAKKPDEEPTVDCSAARKSEAFGAMVAAACAVPAAQACQLGVSAAALSPACIKSLSCEIGSIVAAFVAAEASYEGDCR